MTYCATEVRAAADRLGYPFILKPSEEGSSVGVTKVKSADQIAAAFALARGDSGRAVMAERFISCGAPHPEFTCAILGRQVLPTVRIEPDGEFYDYRAKYLSSDTRYACPSGLPDALETRVRDMCLQAFDLLGARGWGRIDFLLDERGEPWLLEANLVPGMTSHSLMPMAARAAGIDFAELVWRILEDTLDPPQSRREETA